jgi:hypothetical protein
VNGRGLREEPEPDSLDAAADEVPSREAHAGEAGDYTAHHPTWPIGRRGRDGRHHPGRGFPGSSASIGTACRR